MAKPSTSTRTSGEILRAARARIAPVKGWTTKALARTAHDTSVDPKDPDACCWCAYGAIYAEGMQSRSGVTGLLERASSDIFGRFLDDVNDHLGHAAVLRIYDRAIQMAETSPVSPRDADQFTVTE